MLSIKATGLAVLAGLILVGPSAAQDAYPDVPITRKEAEDRLYKFLSQYGSPKQKDLNGDGIVDFEEFRSLEWKAKTLYDFDYNGGLDWPEYLVGVCPLPGDVHKLTGSQKSCLNGARTEFLANDKSKDGLINYDEARTVALAWYKGWKRCADGKVHVKKCK